MNADLWPEDGPSPLARVFDDAQGGVSIQVVVFHSDGRVSVGGGGERRTYTAQEWAALDGRGPGEIPPLLTIPRPQLHVRFVEPDERGG